MPVSKFPVTLNVEELGIDDATSLEVSVSVNTDDGTVDYPTENYTFSSAAVRQIDGGTGSFELPIRTGANPANFEFRIDVLVYRSGRPSLTTRFAPRYLPAPTTTTPVAFASLAGTSSVPASWMTAATVALQAKVDEGFAALASQVAAGAAARDAAVAAKDYVEGIVVTDLGTSDGQMKALAEAESSQFRGTLNAAIGTGTTQKTILGGSVPRPQRAPVVTIEKSFPNQADRVNLVWTESEGATLYGIGYDGGFMKSTDAGKTWVRRAYLNWGPGYSGCFLKTSTGTLLTFDGSFDGLVGIRRSTDDGATWTVVHPGRANTNPLGSQGWDIDPVTGYIYYGEYNSGGAFPENRAILWRSTDDGATWTEFASFNTTTGAPDKVSHIHAVQWDHVAARMVVCVGDSSPKTGLYRVNAAGTGVEPIVTNDMLAAEFLDAPRSIGIMPFPDYIVWGSDSTTNPWIFRMARTEIGKPAPVIERLYRLNSTAWWTCRASADGSRWVLSASQEHVPTQIDKQVHLYAVEDQGATIYEVGALAVTDDTLPAGSLQPVGLARIHGNRFSIATRGVGRSAAWQCRLAYGGPNLPWPEPLPPVAAQMTFSSGRVEIPAAGEVIFGGTIVPSIGRRLCIFETSAVLLAGPAGSLRVDVRRKAAPTGFVHRGLLPSERQNQHLEMAGPIATYVSTASDELEFVVRNLGASTATATAAVTFGFSLP